MSSVQIDVKDVAHLARLALTPDEIEKIGGQLTEILAYVEKLKELDVSHVEPTAHAVPLANITRPDQVMASLPREQALANAPSQADGLFLVPKIVE